MKKPYPYRFKTEAEFIKEFGENWTINDGGFIDWVPNMNYLFGKPYPFVSTDDHIKFIKEYGMESVDKRWNIEWNMLIKTEIIPNYKPRKKR